VNEQHEAAKIRRAGENLIERAAVFKNFSLPLIM